MRRSGKRVACLVQLRGARGSGAAAAAHMSQPAMTGGERIEHGRSIGSLDAVRAHYDRYGFYFAESEAARRVFARLSQLGSVLRSTDAASGTILDVGCGEGRVYALLDDQQRARYVGVDFSDGIIARARGRQPGARFLRGDATALPVREATAALVICQGVLHHTTNPRAALAELGRATRPGGAIQLSVYNRRALYYYLFVVIGPLCFRLANRRWGRAILAATLFPVVYALLFEPMHLIYGVHMPLGGAWRFFLDQFAHPRVWFFRRGELHRWLDEEDLKVVRFDRELAGWMLSFVLRKPDRRSRSRSPTLVAEGAAHGVPQCA
jgi:ubiquinone/menaquinone biosynthesis C-methylase UbiE